MEGQRGARWERVSPAGLFSTLLAVVLLLATAVPAAAQSVQQNLRTSRAKLDSIQAERQRLQQEMDGLRTRVRDTSRELENIERQRAASRSAMLELDYQMQLLLDNVMETTRAQEETRQRMQERAGDLHARVRSIYKRGPLHAARVILTAQSFGDLLNRYRYLHLMTRYDQMVIEDAARLDRDLAAQERELQTAMEELDRLRGEKTEEVAQLNRVERQRQTTLRNFQQQETRTASRIAQLEREQRQMANTIEELERRRRAEEAAGTSGPATISTRDLGTLPWPVEGNVVYRFGPDRKPDGIVLKNQGIGIGAAAGTPVKAVEAGVVEFAGPYPGYGNSVIVSHGGGYRTLYLYLRTVSVRTQQQVKAGDTLGAVGAEQSAEGPHMEFQVRVPMNGGTEAVDPLAWLRGRAGR